MLLQLVPRAAEQQGVARPQGLVGALEGVAGAVHGEHDEVAARSGHAGEEVLADEWRAGCHEHLAHAPPGADQLTLGQLVLRP